MNCHFCKKHSQTEVKIYDENDNEKMENVDTPICDDCLKGIWGHCRSTLNEKWGEKWKRDYRLPLEKRKIIDKGNRHEIELVLDKTKDFEIKELYPCSYCNAKCFVHDRLLIFYKLFEGQDGKFNEKQVYATKTIALLEFIRNYQGY